MRADEASESVRSLQLLLRDVIAHPTAYLEDGELTGALKSQGALTAYANPARQIVAMSLNHQKKVASGLVGGFALVDDLRIQARSAVLAASTRAARGKKASIAGLEARLSSLTEELRVMTEDMLVLQRAYILRCKQARAYARKAGEGALALCVREQEELDISLGLMRRLPPGNVISYAERKRQRDGSD